MKRSYLSTSAKYQDARKYMRGQQSGNLGMTDDEISDKARYNREEESRKNEKAIANVNKKIKNNEPLFSSPIYWNEDTLGELLQLEMALSPYPDSHDYKIVKQLIADIVGEDDKPKAKKVRTASGTNKSMRSELGLTGDVLSETTEDLYMDENARRDLEKEMIKIAEELASERYFTDNPIKGLKQMGNSLKVQDLEEQLKQFIRMHAGIGKPKSDTKPAKKEEKKGFKPSAALIKAIKD